jgi:tetratricopeptide (TPR) repeat protein
MGSSIRSQISLLLLLGATVAAAAPPSNPVAQARAAVKEARSAYDSGDFDVALFKYEEAYRLVPLPALQFNLGQCHRHLGHHERALFFFRRFLESNPPEEQAAQVRPMIADLETKLSAEERAKAEQEAHQRQLELEQAKTLSAQAQAEAAAKLAEEMKRRVELEEALRREIPPPEPPLYQKGWFWGVVGGVAAAAIAVGVGVGVGTAPRPTPTTFPDINAR